MDSFELNKILGAILGTLLFVMGVGFLADAIYAPAHSAGPGYELPAAPAEGGPGDKNAAPAAVTDIGTLLAKADPKAGEAAAKKCAACHDFTEGGPNKTGPNLYGIVGEKIADVPGFAFSDALKAHSSETWDYAKLNQWLLSPKTFAPGTKMTYAGDKDDTDRANLIAYLSTLSKSPVPFPPPGAPAAPAAPAAGASSAPPPAASSAPAAAPASSQAPAAPASSAPAAASSEAPASSAPAPAASSAAATASSQAAPASSSSSAAQ